jgi:hypothetical protein
VSNRPTIEHLLTPAETSYLMDLLHADWNRQVMADAALGGRSLHDDHVWRWRKSRASRLLNKLDDNAYRQGFWSDDGKGL